MRLEPRCTFSQVTKRIHVLVLTFDLSAFPSPGRPRVSADALGKYKNIVVTTERRRSQWEVLRAFLVCLSVVSLVVYHEERAMEAWFMVPNKKRLSA